MADKHVLVSIMMFILVDLTVITAFFLPDWFVANVGGHIQIGLWQTCIGSRKTNRCFLSSAPFEWLVAIVFIIFGCLFDTLAVVAFVGALKTHRLVQYGRWLGLAALTCFCIASICIPMGFGMDAIKGEPFQMPSSFNAGQAFIIFNAAIWLAYVLSYVFMSCVALIYCLLFLLHHSAISELFAGKICMPNF